MSKNSDLTAIDGQLNRYFGSLVEDGGVSFEPAQSGADNTVEIGYTFNPRDDEDALPDSFERTCKNIARQHLGAGAEVQVARREQEAAPATFSAPAFRRITTAQ